MRILHLIPNLSGGGAERQLAYLARESARKGHEVHIGALHPGPDPDYECPAGVEVHFLPHSSNYDPRILLRLFRLIREIKPDIIQTWIVQMDILGGMAAMITGTPWILREPSSEECYSGSWKDRLRLLLGKRCQLIVSNSASGEGYWGRRYPGLQRRVIPNGLPLAQISGIDREWGEQLNLESGEHRIISACRLVDGKNLENLLMSLVFVLGGVDGVALICGEGPLRSSLIQRVKDSGFENRIRLPGIIDFGRLMALMKGADLFVFASEFEGFPNVIAEAMICGCPLVVSDIPAHREFLDETMAVFVDPRDPRKIADAILDSLGDPEGLRRRARNAREKSRKYSVEAMADGYEMVYREVVSRACADPRRERT